MKAKKERPAHRQRGFSTLQVVAALAIAGTLTAAAARVLFPMYKRAQINNAYEELYMITHSIHEVREYNGNYVGVVNFAFLVANGYIPTTRYTDGVNENAFGETITATPTNGNNDLTLTYVTDSNATCENLADRSVTLASVSNPGCNNATLTVTVS